MYVSCWKCKAVSQYCYPLSTWALPLTKRKKTKCKGKSKKKFWEKKGVSLKCLPKVAWCHSRQRVEPLFLPRVAWWFAYFGKVGKSMAGQWKIYMHKEMQYEHLSYICTSTHQEHNHKQKESVSKCFK